MADHPVHELIARRWSPYAFAERPVADEELRSLFEAARWAASSYNEQPWSYVVARKEQEEEFARVLSCLSEGNQEWACHAPVLALSVARLKHARDGRPNRAALHDLGLAAAQLTLEATARGLAVHQMIGILPERARVVFQVPEGHQVLTGLAIGYAGDNPRLPERFRERDQRKRERKKLGEFVFSGKWGTAAPLVG
jgi:nitroreductase